MYGFIDFDRDPNARPELVFMPDLYFGVDIAGRVWTWMRENIPARWRNGTLEKQPIRLTVYQPCSDEVWFDYTLPPPKLYGVSSEKTVEHRSVTFPQVQLIVSGATRPQNAELIIDLSRLVTNFMRYAEREYWKQHPGEEPPAEFLTRGSLSPTCLKGLSRFLQTPKHTVHRNCSQAGLASFNSRYLIAGANTSEPPPRGA